ncbi:MAG TPA: glycosyltransferase family 39 protein [Opitutaceae bacterium]|nr:glycosyltransferase family 39 protein [Opitutaceae bacterium]HND63176.1 glycosyltransferase family 39 protein [Opitutaceae bacterium]
MTPTALSFLVSDKRFWLFCLSGALAALLGFYAIPGVMAIVFVSDTGYWFELVAFFIFAWSLWRAFRDDLRALHWRTIDWATVAVVGLSGLVLLVHETFGFKIVMDEIMLLGTSMSMHFDRLVLTPVRGNDIQGVFVVLDGIMDKRPLFFPFLLSVLHDLFGYRPENAFLLNAILTFIFLGLVNRCGQLLAGRRGGWLGVLLFAGLPLLGQNATGGGFELLNMVMIIATLLLGARFIDRRDEVSLTALCYSTLLLGQTRYESLVYALPVVVMVLWVWFRERRAILSWPVIVAPLLLLPYPLQNRIFELRTSAWQLASKPEYSKPFSLSYISDNLAHAESFFFSDVANQPASLTLSILGWLAVPFCLLFVVKKVRTLATEPPIVVASVIFTLGFVGQFFLMMCYFWGKFDDPIIRRLSLPTHLWLVVAVLTVLPQFASTAFQRLLLAVAAFGALVSGIPSMAAHAYNQEYLPGRETAWRRQFMADQPRSDYLMIDNDSILWVAHRVSATPVVQAVRRRDAIVFHMRNHTFSNVYVFQRFNIDPANGAMTLRDGDDLGPAFVLEPVREERLQTLTLDRISRVKEIRQGPVSLTAPTEEKPPVVPRDREEVEKRRKAYLENFLKQLP